MLSRGRTLTEHTLNSSSSRISTDTITTMVATRAMKDMALEQTFTTIISRLSSKHILKEILSFRTMLTTSIIKIIMASVPLMETTLTSAPQSRINLNMLSSSSHKSHSNLPLLRVLQCVSTLTTLIPNLILRVPLP